MASSWNINNKAVNSLTINNKEVQSIVRVSDNAVLYEKEVPITVTLSSNANNPEYLSKVTFTCRVKQGNNNVSGASVSIRDSSDNVVGTATTNSSGVATYKYTCNSTGDLTFYARVNDVVSENVSFHVYHKMTNISIPNPKVYGDSQKLKWTFVPAGAYFKSKITLNKKTYTVHTDASGEATMPINLRAGTYSFTIVWEDVKSYSGSITVVNK